MTPPALFIDPDRCKHDGLCASVCPCRIFVQREPRGLPVTRDEQLCVYCGHCVAACPNEAITHDGLAADRFVKIEDRAPVAPNALAKAVRMRRSVRRYRKRAVPREVLEQIVGVAAFAPNGSHGEGGRVRDVVVVNGEAEMQRCLELTAEYMRQLGQMLGSTMVRLVSRFMLAPQQGRLMLPDLEMRLREHAEGRDAILYGAPAAVFLHRKRESPVPQTDCDAAMMAILLMAQAHDLGTCWNGWLAKAAGGFRIDTFTEFRRWLEIPDEHDVYAAAVIGYPAVKMRCLPDRETRVRWIGD